MSDESRDVIAILEEDHREVEEMFQELERLRGDTSEDGRTRRKELMDQVTIELVRHSVAEEVLVYPEVERKISADEAKHAREEHGEAEETLARLEKLDPSDAAFDEELEKLTSEIRHHIKDEEEEMFAHMRETFSDDELRSMGTRVEAFKKVAPTRPHPTSRTRRCRASSPGRSPRWSTACATWRRAGAAAADRHLRALSRRATSTTSPRS